MSSGSSTTGATDGEDQSVRLHNVRGKAGVNMSTPHRSLAGLDLRFRIDLRQLVKCQAQQLLGLAELH